MSNSDSLGSTSQPWFKKKKIVIPGVIVLLLIIGSASGGGKSSTGNSSSGTTVSNSNPLNTSANKTACETGRFIYAENSQVIKDWQDSAATDAELATALKKIGDNFYDIGSTASGDLQSTMMQIGTYYKKARVAAVNVDSAGLLAALQAVLPYATTFDNDCKSIGKN